MNTTSDPALPSLGGSAPTPDASARRWTEDDLREPLEWALNQAWSDFVADTGCYPDCITVIRRRGQSHLVEADFRVSNFASFAAGWLASKLNERATLPSEGARP